MLGQAPDGNAAHLRALAEYLALVQRDTPCHGDQGWWDHNVALLTPWGFDPMCIRVPVQLWHGERDAAVPPARQPTVTGSPGESPELMRTSQLTTITAACTTGTRTTPTTGSRYRSG